jgi:hypothetical protein
MARSKPKIVYVTWDVAAFSGAKQDTDFLKRTRARAGNELEG